MCGEGVTVNKTALSQKQQQSSHQNVLRIKYFATLLFKFLFCKGVLRFAYLTTLCHR